MSPRRILSFAVCLLLIAGSVFAGPVIIHASKPYDSVRNAIIALGGTVTYEFKNANAIAATLPDNKVDALTTTPGVDYYVRDANVLPPVPSVVNLSAADDVPVDTNAVPANYFPYNTDLTNASALLAAGFSGQGVVVGVIDTGVAPVAALGGTGVNRRVIGGESFVPGEPDANASTNHPHGTWVSCNIGANVGFLFSRTSTFARAVRAHCNPVASSPCSTPFNATLDLIPMVGQAPSAKFYALKVFPANGAGAPSSRIMAAMDRAIELKKTTQPNMRVVNMSLGGGTLFAGGEAEDELATSMAANGITLVVAAGNAGPSGMTVGSPGTALNILTSGAGSSPVHERILRDLQYGAGIGILYRPDNNQQMATFSSRGPNADGRVGPNIVANGLASYVQGPTGGISFVSGTSLSTPTISGVAALLYSVKPTATPQQVRSAILLSGRKNVIPTATAVDQGSGYVDAAGAKALLGTNPAVVSDNGPAKKDVAKNIEKGAGVDAITKSDYTAHVTGLRPAERREFFFTVRPDTATVKVTMSNITPALPPAQQNQLFGDDVFFTVHSAKTSEQSNENFDDGDYLLQEFLVSNKSFTFDHLDSGLMRLTVNGDWTNVGNISADITIHEESQKLPKRDIKDKIAQGELRSYSVTIDPGTASATFRLSWDSDWAAYPTNDLDLILVSPTGVVNFKGATVNSPEIVTITNPTAGTWTVYVDGFTVWEKTDKFEVRVTD